MVDPMYPKKLKLHDNEKIIVEIYYDDLYHWPYWIYREPSTRKELIIRVEKGHDIIKEYSAPLYYLNHFHRLLHKEGLYPFKYGWIRTGGRTGLSKYFYLIKERLTYKKEQVIIWEEEGNSTP